MQSSSRYLLQDRYVRIDALQSGDKKAELALDVATPRAQGIIVGPAESTIDKNTGGLDRLTSHKAANVTFYHGPTAT